jgi:hypothetical protein
MYAIGLTVGVIFVAGLMSGALIYDSVENREHWRITITFYLGAVAILGGFVFYVAQTSP